MVDMHVDSLAKLLREIKAKQPSSPASVSPELSSPSEDDTAVTIVRDIVVPKNVTRKNVFRHPEAHPVILDLLLIDKYGGDWLGWEYETLEHRIPKEFGVDGLSDLNMSKIQAMKALHLVDTFWQRWETFVWCAMPLNALYPDFAVMQVPTVLQCMIAVDAAKRVRDDMDWSAEMKLYLSMVHRHDGILQPLAPLNFVEVDTVGLPVDMGEVYDRWFKVRTSGKAPTGDTPEDEQLRRMLELTSDLERNRAQLRQQTGVLRDA